MPGQRRLVVTGRGDDAVTTGGATVLVADVEDALRPVVAGGLAVLGVPHDTLGHVGRRGADRSRRPGRGPRRGPDARRRTASAGVVPPRRAAGGRVRQDRPRRDPPRGRRARPGACAGSCRGGRDGRARWHPVCVVDALRTPIGTAGRGLAAVTAAELAAPVLSALVAAWRCRTEPGARAPRWCWATAWGRAATWPGWRRCGRLEPATPGWGRDVPALTVDRQCAQRPGGRRPGGGRAASHALAPASCSPVGSSRPRPRRGGSGPRDAAARGGPVRYERAPFAPAEIGDPDMGLANDLLAEEAGVTRASRTPTRRGRTRGRWRPRRPAASTPSSCRWAALVRDERPRERTDGRAAGAGCGRRSARAAR